MADKGQLEVKIRATIANANELRQELQDKIAKNLVVFSDKDMQQLANRIYKTQQLLETGVISKARKAAESLNNFILTSLNKIGVEAGAASNQLAELEAKLQQLKKERAQLTDPNDEYTKPIRALGGRLKRRSALTETELGAIGIKQQPDGSYYSNLTNTVLQRNWSISSYAYSLADRYNQLKVDPTKNKGALEEIEKALNTLNLEITQDGALRVKKAAEEAFDAAVRAFNQAAAAIDQKIRVLEGQVQEERINAEGIKVIGDDNISFDTKKYYDSTINQIADLQRGTDEWNRAVKEEKEAQNQANDVLEETSANQHKVAETTKEATTAQNKQTSAVGRAVTTFFGYQMVLRQLRRLWREAIHTIQELDKQLTTQAMVTGMTREETWGLVQSYQEIAQATGLAQTTIAGVTTEYLRQGESLENALTLTKAAAAAATVAGISASDSVKYLTTAIHGFKLEAEDALAVSDKFAALAAEAATNYEDLAVALSKVASQASLAGMSMDYTLALLTTGLDVTQEAPESIGTALKTVIARMREISDYGKTLEEDTDLNQVESGLRAVGIALRDGTGELRSTEAVLDELGKKWSTLTANQQAAVAKALAGTRQQSRLVAIMENYDKVLDYQQRSMTSIGATTAQQVTYLQGMEAATNNLQSTYQSLINSIVHSDEAIAVVNTLRNILQWIGNFLKQPAGRIALISGITTMLLKSQELINKIKSTVNQLIQSLSGIHRQEQQIIQDKEKQLQLYQSVAYKYQAKNAGNLSYRPNGWLSNDPNASTIADVGASFTRASLTSIGAIFNKSIRDGFKDAWAQVGKDIKSWIKTNSLVGKVVGGIQSRKANKTILAGATTQAEGVVKTYKKDLEDFDKLKGQMLQAQEQWAKNQNETNRKTYEDALGIYLLAKQQYGDALEAKAHLAVLQSRELSNAQKIEYLKKQELLAAKKIELTARQQAELETKSTAEEIKQLEYEIRQTQENATQAQTRQDSVTTGSKLSQVASLISGVITAISTLTAWVEEMVDISQNYAKELAANAIEEGKRVQSEMYQNTQIISAMTSAVNTFDKLSRQIVKTTDDIKNLEDAQQELAEQLEMSVDDIKALSPDTIDQLVQAKRLKLEEKNQELAQELNDILTAAGGASSFGQALANITGKAATGFGVGAGIGSTIGTYAGMAAGTAMGGQTLAGGAAGGGVGAGIGGLIGAAAGIIAGVIEEAQKAAIAADARNKINALLETDEGVEQFQYALKLNYQKIAKATEEGGTEMADAMSALFSSVIELFDGDDLKAILNRFNYSMVDFANYFNKLLGPNIDAIKTLTSDESNIGDRIKAAQQINAATAGDEQLNAAFQKINYNYLKLGSSLTQASIDLVDQQQWSLSTVSAVVNAFGLDLEGLNETFAQLDAWLQAGATDTSQLADVVKDLSKEELKAITDMITGGRSLQDVADTNTRNRNQVANFRETQAKWNTMSESEQQRFIDENIDFFTNPDYPKALEKFFTGQDITPELTAYQAKIQAESKKQYEEQRKAVLLEIEAAHAKGNEKLEAEKRAYLAIIEHRLEEVDHMFDLSLEEIVNKQNEQIEKLKEMYQAEEEALVESLNKRKEAYQKYFDSISKAEKLQEYEVNRDQLLSAINRLTGGTDATSRNKLRDLQKQLKQAEEQEAQRRREDARQELLDNIDNQVAKIQEDFEKLLSNNKELLAKMDSSTELQYRNYLATLGLTEEDIALRVQKLSDLFKGTWGAKGVSPFNPTVTTNTPSVNIEPTSSNQTTINITGADGQQQQIHLTAAQTQALITQMLQQINSWTGSNYSMSSKK